MIKILAFPHEEYKLFSSSDYLWTILYIKQIVGNLNSSSTDIRNSRHNKNIYMHLTQ